MALNLGDINFGLGVNTQGLNKAIDDIVKFGQVVEQASARTTKGSRAAAAALRQQERAALNAVQQTLQLQHLLSKANAPASMFAGSARALREMTQELTRGRLSALEYQRALEKFQADLGRNRRELDRYARAAKEGITPTQQLAIKLRNLTSSATIALGPLSGLGSRISALTSITTRSGIVVAGTVASIIASTIALTRAAQNAIAVGQQLDQVRARFQITTGPAIDASEFERIRQLANAAGTEFIATANAFTRLQAAAQGTVLQGKDISQIFEDILFSAAQFQLTTEDLTGTLLAFEQMISKGVVQAEELRGQLGDRLVGAFNVAAQAMGVTTRQLNDMLRAGDVATADFLPKFAAAFREALGARQVNRVETFRATMNRLTNAQTHFSNQLDRTFGISKTYQAVIRGLTNVLNTLADNMDSIAVAAASVSGAMLFLVAPEILSGLGMLAGLLKRVTIAVLGLSAAATATPLGTLLTALTRLGLLATGAAAGYYIMTAGADAAADATKRLADSVDDFLASQRNAQRTAADVAKQFMSQVDDQIQALQNARLVEQRRLAELQAKFGNISPAQLNFRLRVEPPNSRFMREWRELQELVERIGVDGLKADSAIAALLQRQRELQDIIDRAARAEARARALQKQAVYMGLAEARQQITRVLEEAAATRGLAGEVERLHAQYRDIDAIEQYREKLGKLTEDQQLINRLTQRYAAALKTLRDAIARNAVDDAAKQLDRMGMLYQAMQQGPEAVEALERSFRDADAAEEFAARLRASGVDLQDVIHLTQSFIYWQKQLNDQQDELNQKARENNIAKVFAEANREIESMQRLVAAFNLGGLAHMEFRESLESITRQVEALEQRFIAVGVAAGDPKVVEVLEQYAYLLRTLDAIRRQAALDQALGDYAREMDQLNRRIEAARISAEALAEVDAAIAIEDQVERMRQRLVAAGDSAAGAAEKARQYGEALIILRQLMEQFNNSADLLAKKLQDVRLVLAEVQARALASSMDRDIDRQMRMIRAVAAFTELVAESGIVGAEASRMIREYAEALFQIDTDEARKQINDILGTLREYQDELAAIQQGPDFYRAFTESRGAVNTIIQFRDSLRAAGASISDTNRLTRELVRTLNELERQRAADRLRKAFADADKELEILQRRIAAARLGPQAVAALDAQLDIERQVSEFESKLREAAASYQLLENAFYLPETIATTETAADRLRAALERIGQLSGLDAGVLELITSLDAAIERVGILSGGLSNIGAPAVPAAPTPLAPTSALTSLTGEQSHLVTPDAGMNMLALLNNQFRLLQEIFGQQVTIVDAIAKAGTSREAGTPNSQHFYGRALDLSLQGMDNATRIKLVQAALATGFTGFGFGENILHVDIGPRRSWAYGNTEFAGRPIAEMQQMVSGANVPTPPNMSIVPTALSPEEIDRRVAAYRAGLEAMAAAERAYTQGTALASAQERIDRLRAEVEAYKQGAAAVEALQAQYARLDEIRDFRRSLEEVGIAQEVVNEKVREFQSLLEERDALRNRIDAFKEFIDVVDNQLVAALDGVSKAFADAVVSGEGLSSLADLGRQVASEILAAFLKLYVLKPLLNDIFPGMYGPANTNAVPGQVKAFGGSGFGFLGALTDALAGLFGTIFSRKGNVFQGGLLQDVKMYRKGGILSGPTLFTTASGPAIGGEAGDEAIVPLVRDSSGNLGIRAVGASGTTIVNFNFPPGTDVTAFRKSEAQLAAMAGRVVSRGIGSL